MTRMNRIIAGSLLAMAAFGATAGEGKGMKHQMPGFSDFDLDGDGVMTEQEFNKGHADRMAKMAEQGRKMKGAENCPGFAGIDSNKDGGISAEEFSAHQAEHMHQHKHRGQSKQD